MCGKLRMHHKKNGRNDIRLPEFNGGMSSAKKKNQYTWIERRTNVKHFFFFSFSLICLCMQCGESGETPKPGTMVQSRTNDVHARKFSFSYIEASIYRIPSHRGSIDRLKFARCTSQMAASSKTNVPDEGPCERREEKELSALKLHRLPFGRHWYVRLRLYYSYIRHLDVIRSIGVACFWGAHGSCRENAWGQPHRWLQAMVRRKIHQMWNINVDRFSRYERAPSKVNCAWYLCIAHFSSSLGK